MPRKFRVYDIELDVEGYNSDIYTPSYDREMYVTVPDDYSTDAQIESWIADYLVQTIEIEVDTPDWIEVWATDANFSFELIEGEPYDNEEDADLYYQTYINKED